LGNFFPVLSEQGGISHRFIIAPMDQMQSMMNLLRRRKLAETTNTIAATQSMGSLVACETSRLALPHVVSSLWRPSPATMQLAERLHTRVDIDWHPMGKLLEHDLRRSAPATPTTESFQPVEAACQASVTAVIDSGTAEIADSDSLTTG
jgi:hypothetical protein